MKLNQLNPILPSAIDSEDKMYLIHKIQTEPGAEEEFEDKRIDIGNLAEATPYDNTSSGLTADNVKDALDELAAGGRENLSDLSDVTITSPVAKQLLQYDATNHVWKNVKYIEGTNNSVTGADAHGEGNSTISSNQYTHAEGQGSQATAYAAHAEGSNTKAKGRAAHAEGAQTTASGQQSHAEGSNSTASGYQSHAEGYGTTSSSYNSHAEGNGTTASNENAHSEGRTTTASGLQSHAEGLQTLASGSQSHAEGAKTQATNYQAHAEGCDTIASGENSHAEGYYTQASANFAHAEGLGYYVEGGSSNERSTASGIASHVEGYHTIASANYTHAEGLESKALGQAAHAEGLQSVASRDFSHAEGKQTKAFGQGSHTEGGGTYTYGIEAHAEGGGTYAYGGWSHTEGAGTKAYYPYSHVEGAGSYAFSQYSHVEGPGNTVKADGSHIEGRGNHNTYYAMGSHTEGNGNTNFGMQSHIEGAGNYLSGEESHVEGAGNRGYGHKNHVEGGGIVASGIGLHAEGKHNMVFGYGSHCEGIENLLGTSVEYEEFNYNNTYAVDDIVYANSNYIKAGLPSSFETFTGDGVTTRFLLSEPFGAITSAYVTSGGTSAYVYPYRSGNYAVFETAPELDAVIKIYYEPINLSLYKCTAAPGKITSNISGLEFLNPNPWNENATYTAGTVVSLDNTGGYYYSTTDIEAGVLPSSGAGWSLINNVLSPFKSLDSSDSDRYFLADIYTEIRRINVVIKVSANVSIPAMWEPLDSPCGIHVEGIGNIGIGDYQHVSGKYNIADNNKAMIIGNGVDKDNRSNALTVDWDGNVETSGIVKATNIPDPPTTDGTYTLTCTVSNGVVTYAWV